MKERKSVNSPTAVKLKSIRIRQQGVRGSSLSIPIEWLRDVDAKPGDRLDIYRDTSDRLIIMPPRRPKAEEGEPA